jgi:transcription initiation factor TFIIIB Brf1 subunit/transcription initiation factor TFIIB
MTKKFDLAGLCDEDAGNAVVAPPRDEPLVDRDACTNCGSTDLDFSDRQITCKSCGCVNRQVLDYRDRRAFTVDQANARSTTSATSYLSHDKNLGSIIGACGKDKHVDRIYRLLVAERKLATQVTDNELKDVIRIFSIIADSNNLGLTRREIEDLIITYRKKFLGTKISIGRPRYAVLLAFVFLEMRNKHRNYLSYREFLENVNLSRIDKNKFQEKEMADDFQSAVMYFIKEHGYKLRQPSVPDLINHVVMKLHVIPMIAVDATRIWHIVAPYYKTKGVKHAGIAVALIPIVARAHDIRIRKKELDSILPGTVATMKFRSKEIRRYLASMLARSCKIDEREGQKQPAIIDLIRRCLS